MLPIATKYVFVVIGRLLPQLHSVAINITYCNKLFIRGNIYNILQQWPFVVKKGQYIATVLVFIFICLCYLFSQFIEVYIYL